jgi:hypothetical protein
MARLKVDWEAVKKSYESGMDRKDICHAFNITPKTLRNKIYESKWTVQGQINAHIMEFSDKASLISKDIRDAHPLARPLIIEKVREIIEDSELLYTNRQLLRRAQNIAIRALNTNQVEFKDIRTLTGAVRDIESIVNPQQRGNVNVAVQNNTEVTTKVELTKEEMEAKLKERGIPLAL